MYVLYAKQRRSHGSLVRDPDKTSKENTKRILSVRQKFTLRVNKSHDKLSKNLSLGIDFKL